jgi:hypothetical protein
VIDVSRHRKITYALIDEYFMAKGLVTWLLSPINLLADLLAYRNKGIIKARDRTPGSPGPASNPVRLSPDPFRSLVPSLWRQTDARPELGVVRA